MSIKSKPEIVGKGLKLFTWCEMARWLARTEDGAEAAPLSERLKKQEDLYEPDGFLLLECNLFDSEKYGKRYALPYGPRNTHTKISTKPFTVDGLASGMVSVMGVYIRRLNFEFTELWAEESTRVLKDQYGGLRFEYEADRSGEDIICRFTMLCEVGEPYLVRFKPFLDTHKLSATQVSYPTEPWQADRLEQQ